MMLEVLRSFRLVGLIGGCAITVFSAIGFAQVVQDDFSGSDPAWMSDGKGHQIAGGKLQSNYDSMTWYEGVDFLDHYVEVTLEVNKGQNEPGYNPDFPAGTHLAIGARGIYDPGILAGGKTILASLLNFDNLSFPAGNLNGPTLYFHELPNAGFGPQYGRIDFGQDRLDAGLTQDFNGEIKMEFQVIGDEVSFAVTELATGWSASIQHTLVNPNPLGTPAGDLTLPGEVGLFASNSYGRSILFGGNQEYDNLVAAKIGDPDFDNNTIVDGNDALVWQRGHGITGTATNTDGDANGDTNVDGLDKKSWEILYGSTGIPPLQSVTGVPEPTSCALLLAGGALLVVRAVRRRYPR